jgi:hypothetical protein
MSFWTELRDDESGAALIEYTTLIGILVVAVILDHRRWPMGDRHLAIVSGPSAIDPRREVAVATWSE